ncbi:hypothetical protein BBP40_005859 [Aspergillus hancockii]|nr:hypothetical protein BBP40_005859 [Aspergillus hancockii]
MIRSSPQGIKKRRRPPLSCTECRRRKVRCDRTRPCGQCVVHGSRSCTYEDGHTEVQRPEKVIIRETVENDASTLNPSVTKSPSGDAIRGTLQEIHFRPNEPAPPTEKPSDRAQDSHQEDCLSSHLSVSQVGPGPIHATLSKTRLYGHGHWMSTIPLVEGLPMLGPISYHTALCSRRVNYESDASIVHAVAQCKQLARDIKKQLPSRSPLPAGIHHSFPNRLVMDELVQIYSNTFESCYRILHLPSFQAEYQGYVQQPETARPSAVVKLSLVMSLAGALHSDPALRHELSVKARSWVHIAQTWLSAPFEKDRLTIDGIQIHCLLLLSRQVNRVGPDLVWISAGSLVRMAMQMGLHQDPNDLRPMSSLQKEVRRWLWYTILEINVQAALDAGMSPTISTDDYNTRPPSNFRDDELEDNVNQQEPPTISVPTPTSFQCLLASSLPLRIEATKIINSLQEGPSYDHVLRVSRELTSACRNATSFLDRHGGEQAGFPQSWCEHLHRRFLLCLHLPYAVQANQNPLYSYSLKVCLEVGLDLVSLLEDDTYHRLLLVGGGMFRDIITRVALIIFFELVTQVEGDSYTSAKKRNRARREPLIADGRKVVRYAQDRVRHGETNVRCYLFVCMAMAQVDAMLEGLSTKEAIVNAARDSLAACHDILKSMAAKSHSHRALDPDLGSWTYHDMAPTPTVVNGDFDFLNDGDIDFGFLDSCFFQQWIDQTLL